MKLDIRVATSSPVSWSCGEDNPARRPEKDDSIYVYQSDYCKKCRGKTYNYVLGFLRACGECSGSGKKWSYKYLGIADSVELHPEIKVECVVVSEGL